MVCFHFAQVAKMLKAGELVSESAPLSVPGGWRGDGKGGCLISSPVLNRAERNVAYAVR